MSDAAVPIPVLIVDDHAMFREGLVRVLDRNPEFHIAGQCSSSAEAVRLLEQSPAAVVLLDVDLGPERALDLITAVRRIDYTGQILILTAGISDQEAVQLVQAGVSGILHKHHSTEVLCATIRKVAAGEVCLEQSYLKALFHSTSRPRKSQTRSLTERDKTVLRLVFHGLTNRQMAERLQISEAAVKASLRQVSDKLGVRTRAHLVKVALEQYRDQLQ